MWAHKLNSLELCCLDVYVVTAQYPVTEDSCSSDKIIEYQMFVKCVHEFLKWEERFKDFKFLVLLTFPSSFPLDIFCFPNCQCC